MGTVTSQGLIEGGSVVDAEVVEDGMAGAVDVVQAQLAQTQARARQFVTELERLQKSLRDKTGEAVTILHGCGLTGNSYPAGRATAFEEAIEGINRILKDDELACDAARL